jgi:hypothetical protein
MRKFLLLIIVGLLLSPFMAGAAGPTLSSQPAEGFFYQQTITTGNSYAKLSALLDTAWGSVQNYGKVGGALLTCNTNNALLATGVGADGHTLYVGQSYFVRSKAEFLNIYLASAAEGSAATIKVSIWHSKE